MAGTPPSAFTPGNPIRWLNATFPPRPRARWLLITMRLSISSLAGTVRTLVSVGTLSVEAMLTAVRAAAPRSLAACAPAAGGGRALGELAGAGAATGFGG